VCGTDTRSAVLDWFVRDAELGQVVTDHLRLKKKPATLYNSLCAEKHYCKTLNFGGSIYYIILAPLILAFLLAGLRNILK